MSIVDFIGFIISFLAIIFLFFRNRYERLHPKENLYELDQAEKELEPNEPLKKFLQLLEDEREHKEQREQRPLPLDVLASSRKKQLKGHEPIGKRKIQSRLEYHELKSPLETRHKRKPEELVKVKEPKIIQIYNKLQKPVDMVVYSEIINKPKGW